MEWEAVEGEMLNSVGKWRTPLVVFGGIILLAVIGWFAAKEIRSPAQVAADTAPPNSSPITVPVVEKKLSTVVIVRGTVKYGEPQSGELATSTLKTGSDLITRPPSKNAQLKTGSVALTVDGRPVFVLPGKIPMHRDLGPNDRGPDVLQLERALQRVGLNPGRVDGLYNSATAQAVASFYLRGNWEPFGPTDTQQDQIRTAQSAAALAEETYLQAVNAIDQAKRVVPPADTEQARLDALTLRDTLDTAQLTLTQATAKTETAQETADTANTAAELANANARRDQQLADSDVILKRNAVETAVDDETIARLRLSEILPDAPASDKEAAAALLRQATASVTRTQAELAASVAAASSVRLLNARELQRVNREAKAANRDLAIARAEESRAKKATANLKHQIRHADRKIALLKANPNTSSLQAIANAARREASRTRAEVARLIATSGIQIPANEILFFPRLPLRVDSVSGTRGGSASGRIMTLTGSDLTIDSSLSVSDRRLVRSGNRVLIEEEDLGIKGEGVVDEIARDPGTNQVDPTRFYLSVAPNRNLPSLLGASVKLRINVSSTKGAVLAVPPNALSVGGDGTSRIQLLRNNKTELIPVVPGLSAEGLVEVRPVGNQQLNPGDLVVVGSGAGANTANSEGGK